MTDQEITALVTRIGDDLQRLENHFIETHSDGAKALKFRFPRGYLRTARHFRDQWRFIRDDTLKRNVAYSLILSDVYRWLLNRTDLFSAAQSMVIKEGVCLVGAIAESVTKDAMQDHCAKQTGFKKRTAKMAQLGIITPDLQAQLDTLWDCRNREHLFLLEECEHDKHTLAHYNSAILTLRHLRESLKNWFIPQESPF